MASDTDAGAGRAKRRRPISAAEIEAAKTLDGDFTRERLRAWGLSWPPKAGWRQRLVQTGVPFACPRPEGFDALEREAGFPATSPLLAPAGPGASVLPDDALQIFTDGSCTPGFSPGGWSFTVYREGREIHASLGGEAATTNNRMELTALLGALSWLGEKEPARIWTDSHYVYRGFLERREGWRRQSWTRGPEGGTANADLWRQFDALLPSRIVEIHWTKGHAGTPGNERADALAVLGRGIAEKKAGMRR
ncbi:ribonuclease H family protein [Aureimonas psammosilenae]|uniref:ribonuclease H family protein n=1 Tax=Aureimonas psammosilenae TaxID=2495496 RepID=UPI001261358A|nr:ribonuclease H [Aureimonas psammosilenae]